LQCHDAAPAGKLSAGEPTLGELTLGSLCLRAAGKLKLAEPKPKGKPAELAGIRRDAARRRRASVQRGAFDNGEPAGGQTDARSSPMGRPPPLGLRSIQFAVPSSQLAARCQTAARQSPAERDARPPLAVRSWS